MNPTDLVLKATTRPSSWISVMVNPMSERCKVPNALLLLI